MRRSAIGDSPAESRRTYSSVAATFFQRAAPRVECAPQPKPSQAPSFQYFRLCRDSRPGRATFEISY
jgi:hypothetical protein